MNAIYTVASASSELGWLLGLTTVTFVCAFVGWSLYAFSPSNAAAFRAAAHLPLDPPDDGAAP